MYIHTYIHSYVYSQAWRHAVSHLIRRLSLSRYYTHTHTHTHTRRHDVPQVTTRLYECKYQLWWVFYCFLHIHCIYAFVSSLGCSKRKEILVYPLKHLRKASNTWQGVGESLSTHTHTLHFYPMLLACMNVNMNWTHFYYSIFTYVYWIYSPHLWIH